MVEASCFQASRVGVEGTETGLGAGPSREDPGTMVPGGAGGDEGAKGGLVSAAEVEKGASEVPFAVPPSVRKWKLWKAEEGISGHQSIRPTAGSALPGLCLLGPACDPITTEPSVPTKLPVWTPEVSRDPT